MLRHLEESAAPQRMSEEVLRGLLSLLGGIAVVGLMVLITALTG